MTYRHTEKMTKNNAWFCNIDFSYTSTANIVAGLLGFGGAWKKDAMGFRNNWAELDINGAFKDCKTVGDCQKVYINSLSR